MQIRIQHVLNETAIQLTSKPNRTTDRISHTKHEIRFKRWILAKIPHKRRKNVETDKRCEISHQNNQFHQSAFVPFQIGSLWIWHRWIGGTARYRSEIGISRWMPAEGRWHGVGVHRRLGQMGTSWNRHGSGRRSNHGICDLVFRLRVSVQTILRIPYDSKIYFFSYRQCSGEIGRKISFTGKSWTANDTTKCIRWWFGKMCTNRKGDLIYLTIILCDTW